VRIEQESVSAWEPSPIGRVTAPLREQVTASLRSAILDFHLRPGQRLVERELIDRFEVSRTTIREALRDLAAEGLVTVIPQKGAIVSAPSPEESADLYDVRAHLESLTVSWFVERATAEQVTRLRRAVDAMENLAKYAPNDTPGMLKAKDDYYEILIDGAGSVVLRQVLVSVQARVRTLRAASLGAPGRSREAVTEISRIVDAIERRDAPEASRLSIEHVQNAARTGLAAISGVEQGPV
jgi:DNA-binding GntR family transcriptional regulator